MCSGEDIYRLHHRHHNIDTYTACSYIKHTFILCASAIQFEFVYATVNIL